MSTLTIALSEERLQKLEEIARRFQIAPEELVRVSIDELLSLPEEDFRRALDLVLNKNAELYQRLA
jgi:predicted transcriptional regulator